MSDFLTKDLMTKAFIGVILALIGFGFSWLSDVSESVRMAQSHTKDMEIAQEANKRQWIRITNNEKAIAVNKESIWWLKRRTK